MNRLFSCSFLRILYKTLMAFVVCLFFGNAQPVKAQDSSAAATEEIGGTPLDENCINNYCNIYSDVYCMIVPAGYIVTTQGEPAISLKSLSNNSSYNNLYTKQHIVCYGLPKTNDISTSDVYLEQIWWQYPDTRITYVGENSVVFFDTPDACVIAYASGDISEDFIQNFYEGDINNFCYQGRLIGQCDSGEIINPDTTEEHTSPQQCVAYKNGSIVSKLNFYTLGDTGVALDNIDNPVYNDVGAVLYYDISDPHTLTNIYNTNTAIEDYPYASFQNDLVHFTNIAGQYPDFTLFTNYKPTDFENPNLTIDEFLDNYNDGYVFCFDDGSSYCSGLSSHDRFIYMSDKSTVVGTLSQTKYKENYYFNPYMTEMYGSQTPTPSCSTGYHVSGNTCVANTYTITYVLNGGTQASSGVPTSYTYGSGTSVNGIPSQAGYIFNGWCSDNTLTSCSFSYTISSTDMGTKIFYAKWKKAIPISHVNKFTACPNYYGMPGGGTPSSLDDCYTYVTAGQYVTSLSLPYNVGTNGSGNIGYSSYNGNKNSGDNLPTNTWFTEFEYGSLYGEAVCRSDSAATWAIATDYVYSKDDNQSAANCWCRFNSSYDSSPDLSYTSKWVYRGYVESCWDNCAESCASAVGADWGFDLRQTLFSTVYPTFDTCPANHYCPGGETQYGDTGAIACPTGTTSPTGSTSINQCIPSSYNITYDYTNGGSGCDNETYTPGTAKDLSCIPVQEGYIFTGWFDAATGGNKVTSITATDTGDKTLYAQWQQNVFDITYDYTNGGSGCDNDTYTAGTAKNLSCIPVQEGYIFTGWFDADTNGNKVTSITIADTGNKTFYAQWTPVEFTITTTNMDADTSFSFSISAAGTFYVDWGDGNTQTIVKTNANRISYAHTYTTAGVHTINMSGQATGYSSGTSSYNAAISFSSNKNIAGISGSLGAIFGTVENPTVGIGQPMFYYTFISCSNLSSTIPETLFNGIYGQPVPWMFTGTFENDSKLSGQIPEKLFEHIEGYPVAAMFHSTFEGCSNLTGNIPAGLFSGIKGAPAGSMYQDTFEDCKKLSSYIPYSLFSQLEGTRKGNDFTYTMLNSGLDTSCPADMYQRAVPLGFNSLNGKAICDFCPEGTHSAAGSTSINQCYDSSYNIYYKYDNGGSGCVDDTYTTGEEKTLSCAPTYTGHVFTGWYTEQQGGSKVEKILSTDTGDKTLYAHWQAQTSSCPYQYTKYNDLCATSVSSGQCLVQNYIPTVPYDVSINGTGTFGARSDYQQSGTNPGSLDTNTFYLDFSYGTLYGEAHCSTTGAATQGTVTDANWSKGNENNGGECWCRLTGDSNDYIQSPLKWAYWGHHDNCWDWCTNQCAYFMQNTYGLRYGVFNLTGLQYTSCEAGYYCPNDKIMYNETGCRQETCPEGYTSDAGATSITQCYKTIQAGHSIDSNYQEILCPAGKYCPNEVKVYYNVTQTSEIEVSCPASYTSDAGATIKQNCYIIIQAGQYANCGYESTTFNPNYQSEYWHKSSTASYPTDWNVNNNSWATIFYNNSVEDADRLYIQGRAACSNLQPNNIYGTFVDNEEVAFNPDTADGNYCWCNVDTPNGSEWINVYADYGERIQTYENATECWYRCAGSCGYQIRHVSEVRQTLCSLTERDTTSCPENYYCPGGTVYFGSTENNTIVPCPAGTTSPANSTSETQCIPAICSANEYKDQDVCKLCPNEWYSPEGSIGLGSCGRILHVGDDIVYLRSQKKTTPSLNFDFDGDGISDFFGNMTPIETNMHQNSTHKLKLNYNDQIMYLYDDTMEVQEQ